MIINNFCNIIKPNWIMTISSMFSKAFVFKTSIENNSFKFRLNIILISVNRKVMTFNADRIAI